MLLLKVKSFTWVLDPTPLLLLKDISAAICSPQKVSHLSLGCFSPIFHKDTLKI